MDCDNDVGGVLMRLPPAGVETAADETEEEEDAVEGGFGLLGGDDSTFLVAHGPDGCWSPGKEAVVLPWAFE